MLINDYISSKKKLLNMFGIKEDYFIIPCINKDWELDLNEDLPMLIFEGDDGPQTRVIVKKGNKPIVVRKKRLTLVVALDCVKICYVFDNARNKNDKDSTRQITF